MGLPLELEQGNNLILGQVKTFAHIKCCLNYSQYSHAEIPYEKIVQKFENASSST